MLERPAMDHAMPSNMSLEASGHALQRASEMFERISAAIKRRSDHLPQELFMSLCTSVPGGMQRDDFESFIFSVSPGLDKFSACLMWQLLDRHGDGMISYEDWARQLKITDRSCDKIHSIFTSTHEKDLELLRNTHSLNLYDWDKAGSRGVPDDFGEFQLRTMEVLRVRQERLNAMDMRMLRQQQEVDRRDAGSFLDLLLGSSQDFLFGHRPARHSDYLDLLQAYSPDAYVAAVRALSAGTHGKFY